MTAWYTASPQDRELSSLASGLATAIRPHVAPLAEEFTAGLAGSGEELTRAEMLAGQLSDALESSLTHDLVLVLDDAHELSSAASLRLVESLCRQAPETLHVVLASREELELRVDRLRAQGQVLELSSADLTFTLEEVDGLSVALLGTDGAIAEAVYAATGGWPAAVRLALETLATIPRGRLAARPRACEATGRSAVLVPRARGLRTRVSRRSGADPHRRAVRELHRRALRGAWPLATRGGDHAAGEARSLRAGARAGLRAARADPRVRALRLAVDARGGGDVLHVRAAAWLESRGRPEDALRLSPLYRSAPRSPACSSPRARRFSRPAARTRLFALRTACRPELRTARIETLVGEAL